MKVFLRPAPGTIRLALFCLAFLLVAWWAGRGWGSTVVLNESDLSRLETEGKVYNTPTEWRVNLTCDSIKSITTDSLAVRIERLERSKEDRRMWLIFLWYAFCVMNGITIGSLFCLHFRIKNHKRKRITEAHK